MLTITKPTANRVDLEVSGQVDGDMMRRGMDDLLEKTADIQNGVMLYRIHELALPTLGAIGVKMEHLPKLFGLLGKIDRCAVLSDAAWIRTAAEIEGAVFPGIEIKAFPLGEENAAEAWLAEAVVSPG
ncbi:MAG: STAS/SEC14 domain-containing protein [Pseudomonadota bacterium]